MDRIEYMWKRLGIPEDLPRLRALPVFPEAGGLTELTTAGGVFKMTAETAAAWRELAQAARKDGIQIHLISAFRGYGYQMELIEKKLRRGQGIEEILQVLAPPGCSEHHTGQALDLGTGNCPPVSEAFEKTAAFEWLMAHAARYGFFLSYPRNNACGYIYEPWHWRFAV